MTNRPKAIGTAAESAVVRYLHSIGYDKTTALRRTLSGSLDEGDVWCHHSEGTIVFEVKGGAAAKNASAAQIDLWLAEAEVEAENSGLENTIPILITQRAGVGLPRAGEWRAWIRVHDYFRLAATGLATTGSYYVLCLSLRDVMQEVQPRA